MTREYSQIIWTIQRPRQWKTVEIGFGRRLDAVVRCYGYLWKIDVRNKTLAVDMVLAGLGIKL